MLRIPRRKLGQLAHEALSEFAQLSQLRTQTDDTAATPRHQNAAYFGLSTHLARPVQ